MKIAVATMDGTSISQHFGRSAGFIVFEVEDQQIKGREVRTNQHTPHAQGLCGGEHHDHGAHGHNHESVVDLLRDCAVVVCGGMGAGAAQAFARNGIQTLVLPSADSAEEAVRQCLQGLPAGAQGGYCADHH
jgi:predicted Fe-Mo cluster-binding NifX family protein